MSRIAEAYARAGRKLDIEEPERWDADGEVAARHLAEVPSAKLQVASGKSQATNGNFQVPSNKSEAAANSQLPTPNAQPERPAPDTQFPHAPSSGTLEVGNWELGVRPDPRSPIPDPRSPIPEFASAIRKIFLSPRAIVRSVFRLLTR